METVDCRYNIAKLVNLWKEMNRLKWTGRFKLCLKKIGERVVLWTDDHYDWDCANCKADVVDTWQHGGVCHLHRHSINHWLMEESLWLIVQFWCLVISFELYLAAIIYFFYRGHSLLYFSCENESQGIGSCFEIHLHSFDVWGFKFINCTNFWDCRWIWTWDSSECVERMLCADLELSDCLEMFSLADLYKLGTLEKDR